jgi:ribonuclease HII
MSLRYENKIWKSGYNYIAGIDEAGRGPLAGPVVAAAVVFPVKFNIPGVDDSKKLSPVKRDMLFDKIISSCTSYGIGIKDESIIDDINILNATFLAMHEAVNKLSRKPDFLIIDGNRFKDMGIPHKTIIKGDQKSFTIAAASIIAKVTRDRIMIEYHDKYPEYNFSKHKGYGTKEHLNLIKKFGYSEIHRKTFRIKGMDN